MLGLFFFSGDGNASTFKQMPMIFPPRQAGGMIGWTSAIAAYGPILFSIAFGTTSPELARERSSSTTRPSSTRDVGPKSRARKQ